MGSRSTGGATIRKQRIEFHTLGGARQKDGPLGDHGGARVRNRDPLAQAGATQGFPLPQHLQNRLRLTRDPVLGEMSDHLLEDGGFLSGSQLGNEERGAEV